MNLPIGFMRITNENKKTTKWTAHLSYRYIDVPNTTVTGANKIATNSAFGKLMKTFDFEGYRAERKAEADALTSPDLPNANILKYQLNSPSTTEEHNGIKFIFIDTVWASNTGFVRVHDSVSYPLDIDFKNRVAYVGIAKNHNINQNLFHHHKADVIDYISTRWGKIEASNNIKMSYIEDMHKFKNKVCLVSPVSMSILLD